MIKECTRPHLLAHLVSSAGLALMVLYFFSSLTPYLLVLGLVLLVGGALWDFASNPAKR